MWSVFLQCSCCYGLHRLIPQDKQLNPWNHEWPFNTRPLTQPLHYIALHITYYIAAHLDVLRHYEMKRNLCLSQHPASVSIKKTKTHQRNMASFNHTAHFIQSASRRCIKLDWIFLNSPHLHMKPSAKYSAMTGNAKKKQKKQLCF